MNTDKLPYGENKLNFYEWASALGPSFRVASFKRQEAKSRRRNA